MKKIRFSNHAIQRMFERDIEEKLVTKIVQNPDYIKTSFERRKVAVKKINDRKMRMTYDKDVDAAYIYIKNKIEKGEVKDTISLNENIILDFDKDRKLVGIEILSASKIVPKKAVSELLLV